MLESMLESEEIGPGGVRPLKRLEYAELVALGAFADEKLELHVPIEIAVAELPR